MSDVHPYVYPEILTKKSWDKNKGTIAKMAGETGMGAAMEACEKGWKTCNTAAFNPAVSLYGAKGLEPDKALQAATAAYPTIDKFRVEVKKFVDLSKKVAEDFKKNKLIPKTSTQHVEEIHKTADHWWIALKGDIFKQYCNEAKTAIEEANKHSTLRETAAKEIKTLLDKAKSLREAIAKNVSAGTSKLVESEKSLAELRKLLLDAVAPGGPIINARLKLETKFGELLDKLAPTVGAPFRKRAAEAFDAGMRDFSAAYGEELKALTEIARQRLTAEKGAITSSAAKEACLAHVKTLDDELKALEKMLLKRHNKAHDLGGIKSTGDNGAKTGNWVAYEAKKQETIEAFAVLEMEPALLAVMRERANLTPETDDDVKKAKAEFLKALDARDKMSASALQQKPVAEKSIKECDALRK